MFEYLRNDSLEVNIINDNVYITNYLEVLSFSREEIKLKHKDGIIYTQKHGCFTFKDYLNNKITEY